MFSKALKGTAPKKNKTTLNWWEYWIGHCYMTGWQSIRSTFKIWGDLMGSNYKDYKLLKEDDPETECLEWFWGTLGDDDVYPKEFLESLLQMVDDVDTGKMKVYPMDEVMDRLKNNWGEDDVDNLVGDFIDDLKLDDDLKEE